jgi:ATP-dependent exoDNAse (exonuclease V) alpha subunit
MDYSFATTVHKSQGSEFDVIFIDKTDIQKSILNRYYETYARLMYVSISRAKQIIYI